MSSSTLIELPPEMLEADMTSTVEFVEARSVEDFAHQTQITDREVLSRVLLPGRQFGPYKIRGFVAAGGMGEIYAAQRVASDGRLSRPVALKVISKEHAHDWRIVERFKREASISKAIRSPHVIRVYEFGETEEGDAFLSMELLAGEELFERMCRRRILPLVELTDVAVQVLEGLGDIHDSGFVHRDIKPENVFMSRLDDGREVAKIIDFGIAKRRDQTSDPLLSVAGQIYGTPQYLAPEQAVDPDVDPRADIYSMGVLLYECATGSLPFDGDTNYSIILAHQNEPVPQLPSSVDPEFAQIVYTALQKDPDDRFQTAGEMARTLQRWMDQTSWAEELPGESGSFEDLFEADASSSLAATTPVPSSRDTGAGRSRDRRLPTRRPNPSEVGLSSEASEPAFELRTSPDEPRRRKSPARKVAPIEPTAELRRSDSMQADLEAIHQGEAPAEAAGRRRPGDPTSSLRRSEIPEPQTVGGISVPALITWVALIAIAAASAWALLT